MLNNEDGNVDSKSAIAKVKFVDNTANNSNDESTVQSPRLPAAQGTGRWIKTSCKDSVRNS